MSVAEPVFGDIAEEWYRVEPGINRLLEKNPDCGLTAKGVYNECLHNYSTVLWMVPEGFMVTRFEDDPYTGYRTLILWLAAKFSGEPGPVHPYLPFFDGVAKHMNCKYIELWSSRPGMERYLARYDFKQVSRVFRKTV